MALKVKVEVNLTKESLSMATRLENWILIESNCTRSKSSFSPEVSALHSKPSSLPSRVARKCPICLQLNHLAAFDCATLFGSMIRDNLSGK